MLGEALYTFLKNSSAFLRGFKKVANGIITICASKLYPVPVNRSIFKVPGFKSADFHPQL